VSTNAKSKKYLVALLQRHAAALGYVLRVVLPVILRTGKRPVIFSRGAGMGDIICTLPAVKLLRERHPGAYFIYNCHPDFAEVLRLAGVADRITFLGSPGPVGHWYHFLLGGFYHFGHGDDTVDRGASEPMVVEFCRQFNLPVMTEHPDLPVTEAGKRKALAVFAEKKISLDTLVLIHPGPSWPVREWPYQNWEHLLAELRARGFNNIAQLGVRRYMNRGKVEVPEVPGAVSLLDAFTVEECIAAIAQAKLFIGIDSGLLHIAAGTRTPSVGIFGMTLPEYRFSEQFRKDFVVNRVECAGCEHRKPRLHWVTGCPYDIRCMRGVRVEDVLRACLTKLKPELVTDKAGH
jgi:ADP-heptose:LPS heptosyltransferase